MKTMQRIYREELMVRHGEQLAETMPQWISAMGLEWLHDLVLRSEDLLKGKFSR
jgi:hypothetical protein